MWFFRIWRSCNSRTEEKNPICGSCNSKTEEKYQICGSCNSKTEETDQSSFQSWIRLGRRGTTDIEGCFDSRNFEREATNKQEDQKEGTTRKEEERRNKKESQQWTWWQERWQKGWGRRTCEEKFLEKKKDFQCLPCSNETSSKGR